MPLYRLGDIAPDIAPDAWVAPTADVMGNVVIASGASVWFRAVIRGDNEQVLIGEGANVQDGCVLHTDPGFPMTIEADVTIGHKVMLHGCAIGARSLIGMGATILNGAVIGEDCLIGAGALIAEGKEIPSGSVVLGAPGKIIRQVGDKERALMKRAADAYKANGPRFRAELVAL
ncbi:MAG: gamma carbonic anhydrase family protein [Pseudomonadota bacterium]